MRKDFGKKPWIYPQPVLIIATYGEDGTPDIMNAAWGGIHDTNQIGICLDKTHRTTKNIAARKAFTVSFADASHVKECDYFGIVSGNKEPDKIKKSGLSVSKSDFHAFSSAVFSAYHNLWSAVSLFSNDSILVSILSSQSLNCAVCVFFHVSKSAIVPFFHVIMLVYKSCQSFVICSN